MALTLKNILDKSDVSVGGIPADAAFGVTYTLTDTQLGFDAFKVGPNGMLALSQSFVEKLNQDLGANTASAKTVLGSVSFAPVIVAPSNSVASLIHQAYVHNLS